MLHTTSSHISYTITYFIFYWLLIHTDRGWIQFVLVRNAAKCFTIALNTYQKGVLVLAGYGCISAHSLDAFYPGELYTTF